MAHFNSSADDNAAMEDAAPPRCEDRSAEFQVLLREVESHLFQYILCLVPNWNNAEDVLQETRLRLWRDFEHFEMGTCFRSWAISMARYQVLTFRKKLQRNRVVFSQELISTLEEVLAGIELESPPMDELRECIEKLPPTSRELLRLCYGKQESVKAIAARSARSVPAIYKAISRIRQALRECIQLSLSS